MRWLVTVTVLLFASVAAYAARPCKELKDEIARKLDQKGIKFYLLEIVPNEKVKDEGKVVGSCDGGKKKILYSRTPATPSKPEDEAKASPKNKP
jgi:Protein of unknown function (DUF1161)